MCMVIANYNKLLAFLVFIFPIKQYFNLKVHRKGIPGMCTVEYIQRKVTSVDQQKISSDSVYILIVTLT